MKKYRLFFLLLVLIFLLVGCDSFNVENADDLPTEPQLDAVQVYDNALQDFDSARIDVSFERQVLIADQSFSEDYQYVLQYKNLNSEDFCAMVTGEVDFGDGFNVVVDERYSDGAVYGFFDDFGYHAESSEEAFFARYIPAVVLDPSLYADVELIDANTISFSDSSELESWLYQDGYTFVDASGKAFIGDDGYISAFQYSAEYTYGAARISVEYRTKLSYDDISVLPPDKHAAKNDVYDANVPMLFERAHAFLMQTNSFSMLMEQVVTSEELDASYYVGGEVYYNYMDELLFSDSTIIQLSDLEGTELSTYTVDELYQDKKFLVSENGEKPVEITVFKADIVGYADRIRSDNFPSLTDIDTLYVTAVPGGVVLDYTFDREYETNMRMSCAELLTGDMNYLERLSSKYTPNLAEGYISIDIYSGLPTALCLLYSGFHTIDGTEREIIMSVGLTIDAASLDAYSSITGEEYPVQESLPQATPAFYQVTGPEGQQMWLMGTMHLGDARTTNLPAEIYAAFNDSDALAVEFDTYDFEEQVLSDPSLTEEVYRSYFYEDGSTIEAHLDMPDLYAAALQTLKLTGSVSNLMLSAKPIAWSQTIENYYVRQGYRFSADYGVDLQLLNLAQEQNKPVLNIESGIEQLHLFTDYSDEVQQMILAGTLSTDPALYNAQLEELFELWCSGDEMALREALQTDTSQMTAEELALYQEYTKAMETDRNVQMLEVAKDYLESGDVVFYAVGLVHLLAEDGLVNTLRSSGYTVEQVHYS